MQETVSNLPQDDPEEAALCALREFARLTGLQHRQRALTVPEFCEAYRISRAQVYVEIKEGRLKIRKVGRRTLIDVDDGERWWAARAAASGA